MGEKKAYWHHLIDWHNLQHINRNESVAPWSSIHQLPSQWELRCAGPVFFPASADVARLLAKWIPSADGLVVYQCCEPQHSPNSLQHPAYIKQRVYHWHGHPCLIVLLCFSARGKKPRHLARHPFFVYFFFQHYKTNLNILTGLWMHMIITLRAKPYASTVQTSSYC